MSTYILTGVVLPERAWFELAQPLRMKIVSDEIALSAELSIWIQKNHVTCVCRCEAGCSDIPTLRNILTECVSEIVNYMALETVVGYEVDLNSLHDLDRAETTLFGPTIPGLSVADHEFRHVELSSLVAFGAKEPLFRRAAGDFKNAIRHPHDTGFFCYRAIESLLNQYIEKSPSLDKKAAISQLQAELNVDSQCLQSLRALSGDPRHGRAHFISGQDRTRAIRATREILLRFAAQSSSPLTSPRPDKLTWE